MDFELTADQEMLRETLRRFVQSEVAPQARVWDRDQALPSAVIEQLAEMGMLGVAVPADFDGAELGAVEIALVTEELARADGALALTVANHNTLGCAHLTLAGSAEQKTAYLGSLARGERLGAWTMTAPGRASGSEGQGVRAERVGDLWHLNGVEAFVALGTNAALFVISAVTDPAGGEDGITTFIVEKDAEGFSQEPIRDMLGVRAAGFARLRFDNVRLPDDQRLGELGRGYHDASQVLAGARIAMAAMAVGLGSGALAASLSYAKERQQFGQPIAEFQAIQWKLADMATELEAARRLTYRAAWLCDEGRAFSSEAAMAKQLAADVAMRAADHAIQIHGGFGYTSEFPPERCYRDARLCGIDKGTGDELRLLVARRLLAEA